ncbi:MAG: zf-HC2 domain-containing protein [Treponema sp.]|jgi:anti-sigma factor RsiW|nr:zf-HC2 domain-containing protein [Treponema sp.]
MCPEQQLLSVYFDGELPSPWKEKMESHVVSCAKCASRLAEFRTCSERLKKKAVKPSHEEEVKERVFQNLVPYFERRRTAVWSRSISLPLPAVAAAAAVFILAFIFALVRPFSSVQMPQSASMALMESSVEMDVQNIVPASEINGIMQYLGQQNGSEYMIIRLPETKNFTSSGEPLIIKAADYPRRVGAR